MTSQSLITVRYIDTSRRPPRNGISGTLPSHLLGTLGFNEYIVPALMVAFRDGVILLRRISRRLQVGPSCVPCFAVSREESESAAAA